jgi:hypothetical protein
MTTIRLLITALILLVFSTGVSLAQNYKIRQTVSMSGQKSESTVYVRGSRKRTEYSGFMAMGNDVANIEQCDLKRNVKISDKKKSYFIEPFDDGTDVTPTTKPTPTKQTPTVKGGVVTYISNITDTGERKQMFGLTARRIKTSMKIEASPDACMKENMTMETDGWYIDLPEFSCPVNRPEVPQMPTEKGGCRDRIQFKTSGGGKLGFPLMETRTFGTGGMSFTQTTETIELSKAPLEAALFDIPQGYTLAKDVNDLYGKPDYSAITQNMGGNEDKPKNTTTQMVGKKKPGMIRIGVYAPTNKTSENVSNASLQYFLVQKLTSGNVEAIGIVSEADARAADCDYVLSSEISKLKQSTGSKIGGIFGKVTNTDTSSTRDFDTQVDFKLVSLSDGKTVAQNKATNKFKGEADKAVESVLIMEAQQVISAIKK